MRFFPNGWGQLWIVLSLIWLGSVAGAYTYACSILSNANFHHKEQYLESIPTSLIVRCTDLQSKSECEKSVKRKIVQPNGYVVLMRVGSDQLDEELVSTKYAEALEEALVKKRAGIKGAFLRIAGIFPILLLLGGGAIYWVMRGFTKTKKIKNRMFARYAPGRGTWEKYIKVRWHHKLKDAPVELYSELDENRYQIRKIEKYHDGRIGFADSSRQSKNTRLDEMPVPPIQEINDDKQFEARLISEEQFEAVWKKVP